MIRKRISTGAGWLFDDSILDVNTMFQILKRRRCESIKPGYAKEKVIEKLTQLNNHAIAKSMYVRWVEYYTYLRFSLDVLDQPGTKNEYLYFEIDITKPELRYGKYQQTFDELMHQLPQQCDMMFNQLLHILDQL